MKYSIIMPYLNRVRQLHKTLASFSNLYGERNDYEAVVVVDKKNRPGDGVYATVNHASLFADVVIVNSDIDGIYNPAPLYNLGACHARGEYYIITSPECLHEVDILIGLDDEFLRYKDAYVVCACENVDEELNHLKWFQHSLHRDAMYHFCTALSRDNYWKIGGFDEEFGKGYCFDDDDFRARVLASRMLVINRDDLLVAHQRHEKGQLPNKQALWDRNRLLYEKKHGKYTEQKLTI